MFANNALPLEFQVLPTVLLLVLLASAVITDVQQHRISNFLVIMVLFGGLIVLTQGSAVAPFIYTIF